MRWYGTAADIDIDIAPPLLSFAVLAALLNPVLCLAKPRERHKTRAVLDTGVIMLKGIIRFFRLYEITGFRSEKIIVVENVVKSAKWLIYKIRTITTSFMVPDKRNNHLVHKISRIRISRTKKVSVAYRTFIFAI